MTLLRERISLIKYWARPADRADVLKQVGALTHAMKLRNWDQATSKALLETYALDVADQPFFAIQDACTAYRRILVGDGWMPTPGELRQESIKQAGWLRKEMIEIERVLGAEVETAPKPVRAEAIKAIVAAMKRDMAMARPKNELARGYQQVADPDDGIAPMEALERRAKAYRAEPVVLSFGYQRRAAA